MIQIPRRWEQWLKALVAAFITGGAQAFLASAGITGAQMVGVNVEQLHPRQALGVAISGGLVGAMAYLKTSPVPPDPTGNTDIIIKPKE